MNNDWQFKQNMKEARERDKLWWNDLKDKPRPGLFGWEAGQKGGGGGGGGGYDGPNGAIKLIAIVAAGFLGWQAMLATPPAWRFGGALVAGGIVAILVYKFVTSPTIAALVGGVFKVVAFVTALILVVYIAGRLGH